MKFLIAAFALLLFPLAASAACEKHPDAYELVEVYTPDGKKTFRVVRKCDFNLEEVFASDGAEPAPTDPADK